MKKVKKIIAITIVSFIVLSIVLFCSMNLIIDNMRISDEYKLYNKFAKRHDAGMTKQEVLDKLGSPVWYVDADGNSYSVSADTQEEFEANIYSNQYVRWVYMCDKTPAYNSRYQLNIYFDSEGKSTDARIHGVN